MAREYRRYSLISIVSAAFVGWAVAFSSFIGTIIRAPVEYLRRYWDFAFKIQPLAVWPILPALRLLGRSDPAYARTSSFVARRLERLSIRRPFVGDGISDLAFA